MKKQFVKELFQLKLHQQLPRQQHQRLKDKRQRQRFKGLVPQLSLQDLCPQLVQNLTTELLCFLSLKFKVHQIKIMMRSLMKMGLHSKHWYFYFHIFKLYKNLANKKSIKNE